MSEEAELARYLALVEGEERRGGGTATGDAAEPGDERDPQVLVFFFNFIVRRGNLGFSLYSMD